MRAAVVVSLVLGACTPEIVPGSYFCGANATCPEDQVCSPLDNTCNLAGLAAPFACESDVASEPDDTVETGFPLQNLDCVTLPVVIDSCMPVDDPSDWVRLAVPADCTALALDTRITFPVAFQRLGLQLVDIGTGAVLATDTACTSQGESGDDLRCMRGTLAAGGNYGVQVAPTGEGDCDGDCAFTRYTLRLQLAAPD